MQWVALEPREFCSPYSMASQNTETVAQREGLQGWPDVCFVYIKRGKKDRNKNNPLYWYTLAPELGTRFAVHKNRPNFPN